jgi:hypothetical protein
VRPTNVALQIMIFGGLFVLFLWGGYAFFDFGLKRDEAGQFGDKFGALNTLFTGLAFVGLVAAFWHEREQATGRDVEQAQLLAAMKDQALAVHRATMFQAKVFRAERVRRRIDEIDEQVLTRDIIGERTKLGDELQALQGELDRFSDTLPA